MEITSKFQERENPPSPAGPGGYNNRSSINGGGGGNHPIPTTRSDPNHPYPTTFVTADTCTFKQVVQSLTGLPETSKNNSPKQPPPPYHHHHHQIQAQDHTTTKYPHPPPSSRNYIIPPIKTTAPKKPQGFKLYERRNSLKNNLMISPLTYASFMTSSFSPRKPEILSPSLLDFPSLRLSPVTPLLSEDPLDKSFSCCSSSSSASEEERAIAEKGFYLHPSPLSTPRETEPQLLPLFPVTSPRVSESAASSSSSAAS